MLFLSRNSISAVLRFCVVSSSYRPISDQRLLTPNIPAKVVCDARDLGLRSDSSCLAVSVLCAPLWYSRAVRKQRKVSSAVEVTRTINRVPVVHIKSKCIIANLARAWPNI